MIKGEISIFLERLSGLLAHAKDHKRGSTDADDVKIEDDLDHLLLDKLRIFLVEENSFKLLCAAF